MKKTSVLVKKVQKGSSMTNIFRKELIFTLASMPFILSNACEAQTHSAITTSEMDSVADVKVIFGNVVPETGMLRISLCRETEYKNISKGGCPIQSSIDAENGTSYIFENVMPGIWGISVYHDANSNNKVDSNFIGIPKEATGTSHNATGKFGPPKFEQIAFEVSDKNLTFAIEMHKVGR